MRALHQLFGALVEAWSEVKVQRARVVLSLVGVVAAVAAMSTVIALGDLVVQSSKEMTEAMDGRATTLHITASKSGSDAGDSPAAPAPAPSSSDTDPAAEDGQSPTAVPDPVGDAMATVADRLSIPYWARVENGGVTLDEIWQSRQTGEFRGHPVVEPELGWQDPLVRAVDPEYGIMCRIKPLRGRWVDDADADQRLTPVVINAAMWDALGRAPIDERPIVLHSSDSDAQFRVVGVVSAKTPYEPPVMYAAYSAWANVRASASPGRSDEPDRSSVEMLVWVGPDQVDEARQIVPRALASVLGPGWEGTASGGDRDGMDSGALGQIRTVIMVIGGIVVFLGALGLLNVAIVTVRQRVREIGIRRALGASAGRVFFAVFMESVVATFLAGVLGVAVAILVVRFLPLESMGIILQDKPAFPLGAACDGLAISTGIGALCGIIPAFAAVRVKPIDAIRY